MAKCICMNQNTYFSPVHATAAYRQAHLHCKCTVNEPISSE